MRGWVSEWMAKFGLERVVFSLVLARTWVLKVVPFIELYYRLSLLLCNKNKTSKIISSSALSR